MKADSLSERTRDERIRTVRSFSNWSNQNAVNASVVDIDKWLASKPTDITRWSYVTSLSSPGFCRGYFIWF